LKKAKENYSFSSLPECCSPFLFLESERLCVSKYLSNQNLSLQEFVIPTFCRHHLSALLGEQKFYGTSYSSSSGRFRSSFRSFPRTRLFDHGGRNVRHRIHSPIGKRQSGIYQTYT